MKTEYFVYFQQIFRSIGNGYAVQIFILPMIECMAALLGKATGRLDELH